MSALPILSPTAPADADPSRIISPEAQWRPRLDRLRRVFAEGERWIVCFSGGVDSAFVLAVAVAERGDDVLALTAVSHSLPDEEREDCARQAQALGARHRFVQSDEMALEGFASNPSNRCYFCKSELYRVAQAAALDSGASHIADGVNVDDLGDHRPGLVAADEASIVHPLVQAGLTKADVRGAARSLGLDVWDKPAFACLSSRFPYGTRITPERLDRVGTVEQRLKAEGFRQVRVRYHGDVVRIEVRPVDLPRLVTEPLRSRIVQVCKDVGFLYVTLDLQGFRSGSMNEGLQQP